MLFNPTETHAFRCRNPRCKSWLRPPAENPRDAFCCEKCAESFYRGHCRVCERPIVGKNSRRELCDDERCRSQFRRYRERFFGTWYPNPVLSSKAEKSSIKSTVKTTINSDRAWRQIAGPDVPDVNLRIPLDPDFARRIARVHNSYWEKKALICSADPPINIGGGYKFPGAKTIDLNPPAAKVTSKKLDAATKAKADELIAQIPDDLSIPDFLKRS